MTAEPRWPLLYAGLSPAERERCLAAAAAGGVLRASQLPTETNGSFTFRTALGEALDGAVDRLAPSRFADLDAIDWSDTSLDLSQRDAVGRALAAPDLFLIAGAPGTGKTRVVAEMLRQAARQGQTVLLTAVSALAVDLPLEAAADCPEILPLRLRAADERPEQIQPTARTWLLEAQAAALRERTVTRAESSRRQAGARRAALEQAGNTVTELCAVARQWREVDSRRSALAQEKLQLPQRLQRELELPLCQAPEGSLVRKLDAEEQRHQAALKQLDERLAEAQDRHTVLEKERCQWQARVRRQEDVVAVKRARRVFSPKWWFYLFKGRCAQRLDEFRQRLAETCGKLAEASAARQQVVELRELECQRHEGAKAQLIAGELQRRINEIDQHILEATQRADALAAGFDAFRQRLSDTLPVPASPADLHEADLLLDMRRRLQEARLAEQSADRWAQELDDTLRFLTEELPRLANVHAGPLAAVAEMKTAEGGPPRYHLGIAEQADCLSEAQLRMLAPLAERWILVGQPPARVQSANVKSPAPFHRLWELLHKDPRSLPYRWLERPNEIACCLLPLSPADQSSFEKERLADQPEIELRILTRRGDAPRLAEVAFPAGRFTLAEAKQTLMRQLEEAVIEAGGGMVRLWRRGQDLVVRLAPTCDSQRTGCRVELGGGVAEVIDLQPGRTAVGTAESHWRTREIAFNMDAGWTAGAVHDWLRRQLHLAGAGRTAWLETGWRCSQASVKLLAACYDLPLLPHPESFPPAEENGKARKGIRFIHAAPHGRARLDANGGDRQRTPHALPGGVIDLADSRQRQQFPLDVQLRLPRQGVVYPLEALALLDALKGHTQSGSVSGTVRVLAWTSPQLALLQCLWEKEMASHPLTAQVEFVTLSEVREREAALMLVSLCVGAGGPRGCKPRLEDWCRLLAASRDGLILVGDWDAFCQHSAQGRAPRSCSDEDLFQDLLRRQLQAGLQRFRSHPAVPSSSA